MGARCFSFAPDGGAMLWIVIGWREAEYHAEWFARGLSIAPNGSEWLQHKKATIK
jgi:hypothetical protein